MKELLGIFVLALDVRIEFILNQVNFCVVLGVYELCFVQWQLLHFSRRHEAMDDEGTVLAFSQLVPHLVDAIKEDVKNTPSLQELKHKILQNDAVGS